MGACYTVRVYLLCHDDSFLVNATKNFVKAWGGEAVFPEIEIVDLTTALQVIFTKRGLYKTDEDTRIECYHFPEDRCWESDFDASYGWEIVMVEWFKYVAPYHVDGSELYIAPDTDWDELIIKNGQCIQTH